MTIRIIFKSVCFHALFILALTKWKISLYMLPIQEFKFHSGMAGLEFPERDHTQSLSISQYCYPLC